MFVRPRQDTTLRKARLKEIFANRLGRMANSAW